MKKMTVINSLLLLVFGCFVNYSVAQGETVSRGESETVIHFSGWGDEADEDEDKTDPSGLPDTDGGNTPQASGSKQRQGTSVQGTSQRTLPKTGEVLLTYASCIGLVLLLIVLIILLKRRREEKDAQT